MIVGFAARRDLLGPRVLADETASFYEAALLIT